MERLDWMVREKIALLMAMVGLKTVSAGTPGEETMLAWLPDTMKRGKTTENTQPAITWEIF